MSVEYFVKDGDSNFITIQPGVNIYTLEQMSGETKEHYIAVRFLDAQGDDVVPTDGIVTVRGSQFRKPLYDGIENGIFNAADVALDTRVRPIVDGPLRAVQLTLDSIIGATTCVCKITGY